MEKTREVRSLSRSALIIFFCFLFPGQMAGPVLGPKFYNSRLAMNCYSKVYGLPENLLRAIRWKESNNGRYTWSNSSSVVSNQEWAKRYLQGTDLQEKYGTNVYACVGDFQVLYLSAHVRGFRGSPEDLAVPFTNCKYACEILKVDMDRYPDEPKKAIAAYNLGHPRINKDGDHVNQEYVDKVWGAYSWLSERRGR